MSDLTVVTVVENDNGILDLMISSILKFTSPTPKIIICSNKKNNPAVDKYSNVSNISVLYNSPKLSGGSNRHGSGLNLALKHVKTSRVAIIESDCVLTSSGWDNLDGKKMLAAIKGRKSRELYHVAFMVFLASALSGMDFRPGNDNTRSSGKSYPMEADVGWRISEHIAENDVTKLDFIDCKTGNGNLLGSKFQSDEFCKSGKTLLLHFGRGSNIGGKAIRPGFPNHTEQLKKFKDIAGDVIK